MFDVGQEVVCVDGSPGYLLWHQIIPVFKNQKYTIAENYVCSCTEKHYYVRVDGSPLFWEAERFAPLDKKTDETSAKKTTGVDILYKILKTTKVKEDA